MHERFRFVGHLIISFVFNLLLWPVSVIVKRKFIYRKAIDVDLWFHVKLVGLFVFWSVEYLLLLRSEPRYELLIAGLVYFVVGWDIFVRRLTVYSEKVMSCRVPSNQFQ